MGKKKAQLRVQESMGRLVSKAALTQMLPEIEDIVEHHVNALGKDLAQQTSNTLASMFTRIVVLETIIIEKLNMTKEEIVERVNDTEDKNENLLKVDGAAEADDVVRVAVKTKTQDQTEYQGESLMKIYALGSGRTIGKELEGLIVGMKAGETKESAFGKDGGMKVSITLNRVSRAEKTEATEATQTEAAQDDNQSQG